MVPIKTSLEDIQKVLGYMARQVGWVEMTKVEKALGGIDDRKVGAMVEFGLILRDGANIKVAPRGLTFNAGDQKRAMREVLSEVELYRATLEWVHYQGKSEITATEIGQYWESSHTDTIGNLRGGTKDGAVCFGRVVEGAGLGAFTIGRGGKETRVTFNLAEVEGLMDGATAQTDGNYLDAGHSDLMGAGTHTQSVLSEPLPAPPVTPMAIGRSATHGCYFDQPQHSRERGSTSRPTRRRTPLGEIFRNMARYVLDKSVGDDDD